MFIDDRVHGGAIDVGDTALARTTIRQQLILAVTSSDLSGAAHDPGGW
jgi:hypothetical protein